MSKNLLWIIVAVVVLGGAYWITQNGGEDSKAAIKLGVIAGTTGDYAAAGEAYIKGFELAREEWNASHMQQFTDVVEDDGFNAQKGVSAYTKLKSIDQVDAYAVLSSFTIDAILDSLHAEGKPVALGFEQSTPATDDNVFQVLPAARPIQKGLGEHLKELGYTNPVVVISNTTPVYANFYAGFVDGYGIPVKKEETSGDPQELRTLATKILAENPDIVVFYMNPPAGALLAHNIITQSKTHIPLAFDQSIQSGLTDYQQVFGASLTGLDNSLVALSRNDFTDVFKKAYHDKYGSDPAFGSDMGYNAFMLLATTYAPDSARWIAHMKDTHFTGADGDFSFDSVGLRVPNIYLVKVELGKFVPAQ